VQGCGCGCGSESEQVAGKVVVLWVMVVVVVVVVLLLLCGYVIMAVVKGGLLLTSGSRRGVPGMDPYAELARVFGGVSRRRPYLSNLAGDAVLDMNEEPAEAADPPDPVRL